MFREFESCPPQTNYLKQDVARKFVKVFLMEPENLVVFHDFRGDFEACGIDRQVTAGLIDTQMRYESLAFDFTTHSVVQLSCRVIQVLARILV